MALDGDGLVIDPGLAAYEGSFIALGALGFVYLVQLLVADVAGIVFRKEPGAPVRGGHDSFLFRAVRAHDNTTESIGIVLLATVFAAGVGADPTWLARLLWAVAAFRLAHALCYWFDLRPARSLAFALGIVALLGIFIAGIVAL